MPALYVAANDRSMEAQNHFLNATKIRLWALIVAAGAGVYSGRIDPPDWIAFLAILAFLVAVGCEIYLLQSRPERTWYEGRAAAESAKSLAWRFGVCGEPFAHDVTDADELLQHRIGEILKDLDVGLASSAGPSDQVTTRMRSLRASDGQTRRNAYRVGRIEDQRDWYHGKAKWNADRAESLRRLAIGLELVGVLAGILAFAGTIRADLLGVFAALTASVVAWLQTKQHETLSKSYAVTAQELSGVHSDWSSVGPDEHDWAAFVDKAEEAISREHKLWRASRGVAAPWDSRG